MGFRCISAGLQLAMALHLSSAASLKYPRAAPADRSMALLQVSSSTASVERSMLLLPSFDANSPGASQKMSLLETGRTWFTRVGSRLYHAPGNSSKLSSRIEDYYYGFGSMAGLTDELRSNRVGGEGRWHIFHFPAIRPSLLQKQASGATRRSSISALRQLTRETTLAPIFPDYKTSATYKNPLSWGDKAMEKAAVDGVTSKSIQEYLQKLVDLKSRTWDNAEVSNKAVSFLVEEFKAMGYAPCTQKFTAQGQNLVNVIAYHPGKQSDLAIVGAHYDSRPFDGEDGEEKGKTAAPGAVDNGSGAAALLAMASAFKKAVAKSEKSVYFVAFGAEEAGLLGSKAFADDLTAGLGGIPSECRHPEHNAASFLNTGARRTQDANHTHAIVMDEIGWVTKDQGYPKHTVNLESSDACVTLMDHLASSSHDYNGDKLNVVHSNNPFGSDHISFLEKGMSSVLTIQADDEGYPDYHKNTDRIENVNFDYAVKIAKMNMGAIVRLTVPK